MLQTLVQGFDPVSGAELPAATPLQHAEVIQALLAGITALEAQQVRTRRRAQLPENVGRPWSTPEEERLTVSFRSGESLAAIAAQHRRTLAAIEARLERLGLLAAAQRTTRNRYVSAPG
jgi:Tfp pilus assembly protein FimV